MGSAASGSSSRCWVSDLRPGLGFVAQVVYFQRTDTRGGNRGWRRVIRRRLAASARKPEDPFGGAPWCSGDLPPRDPAGHNTTGDELLNALQRAPVATPQLPDLT